MPVGLKMPLEISLVLKIVPNEGNPFYEAASTMPPLNIVNHLQIGNRVEVLYAP